MIHTGSMKKIAFENIPSVIDGFPVVQDIEKAVQCLTDDKVYICRYEFGDSMMPILRSGQFCAIHPLEDGEEPNIGDAVFCSVSGYVGTHMVLNKSKIDPNKTWYMIGTTDMTPIGWTDEIYGIANAMDVLVSRPAVRSVYSSLFGG